MGTDLKKLTADELLVAVPSDLLREALFYAVAHGWRPTSSNFDLDSPAAEERASAKTIAPAYDDSQDYEKCALCGFDHEYEPAEAQAAHNVIRQQMPTVAPRGALRFF